MANNTKQDQNIDKLQSIIDQKKEELSKIKKPQWATNCSIDFLGIRYNLHVLDEEACIHLLTLLMTYFNNMDKAIASLDSNAPATYGGYLREEWYEDIKLRHLILQKRQKEKMLKTLESKLDSLLSEDRKAEKELSSIEELLKNI